MDTKERMFDIFMGELKHQCRFAAKAYDDIIEAVQKNEIDNLWYSVQSFLISIGNISKILWPPDKKCIKRGQELRKYIGVENISPLKSREFRNHFEHFDERIQNWAETIGSGLYMDTLVTDRDNLINDATLEKNHSLRHFVTNTFTLKFRGERYELKPVGEAIVDLHKKIVIKEYEERQRKIAQHMKFINKTL